MSAPKTALSPAARCKVVARARFMAADAGPMIRNMVAEIEGTRHSIASMAEMIVHFIEGEEARHPPVKIDDRLTPLEKVKAVVMQIRQATYEIGSAAHTADHWGREIEPLSRRWRKANGGAR
jgi:hypothetical protein